MKSSFFALAILWGGISLSQTKVDSLKNLLENQNNPSLKIEILLDLQDELVFDETESAFYYASQALEIAEKIENSGAIAQCFSALGSVFLVQKEHDSALLYFNKAHEEAIVANDLIALIKSLTGLGKTMRVFGDWELAVNYHLECIEIAQGLDNWIAESHNNLGNIYLDQHQLQKALEHYQKCSSLLSNERPLKAITTMNIGLVHFRLTNFEKAIKYFEESMESASLQNNIRLMAGNHQKIGFVERKRGNLDNAVMRYNKALELLERTYDPQLKAQIHSSIGNIFYEKRDFHSALEKYHQSLQEQISIGDELSQCYTMAAIGSAHMELKKYDLAEEYTLKAMALSQKMNDVLISMDAAQVLSVIYAEQKQFEKALEYHKTYKQLTDSIFNERKANQIAEMATKYETIEKEKAIALLNAENEISTLRATRQENQRNIFIILALTFLAIGLVLYSRYRMKVRSNKELHQLDEMKTRFFTNISHEFRTPLTLILGPLQSKINATSDPTEKDQLELIKRNAEQLHELTNQVMDLSKLEAGKLNLKTSEEEAYFHIRSIASSFESLAEEKEIDYIIEVPNEKLLGQFDSDNFKKIFTNLLSNAFKFTPNQGHIRIEAGESNSALVVEISDTGSGIPNEHLNVIFKRFERLKEHELMAGTGIGLALVKELITLHGGTIDVQSEVGKGTKFTVIIPVNKKGVSQPTNNTQPILSDDLVELSHLGNADKNVLLVIEDNKDVQSYISSILNKEFHLLQAYNGADGLIEAQKHIPDLIISDLMMPGMDGTEMCDLMKNNEKTSHIPIIMLTARADKESKLSGLLNGADDYLTKPFDEQELLIRIKNLIEQRNKLRQVFGQEVTLEPTKIALTPPDEIFVSKAVALIETHLSDVDFTVEKFQREMSMSRMQLHRKLKALTNYSGSGFIRVYRLKRAAQILETDGISVSEAAFSSGFNNLSYFAKCFKEQFGVTPSKYPSKKTS